MTSDDFSPDLDQILCFFPLAEELPSFSLSHSGRLSVHLSSSILRLERSLALAASLTHSLSLTPSLSSAIVTHFFISLSLSGTLFLVCDVVLSLGAVLSSPFPVSPSLALAQVHSFSFTLKRCSSLLSPSLSHCSSDGSCLPSHRSLFSLCTSLCFLFLSLFVRVALICLRYCREQAAMGMLISRLFSFWGQEGNQPHESARDESHRLFASRSSLSFSLFLSFSLSLSLFLLPSVSYMHTDLHSLISVHTHSYPCPSSFLSPPVFLSHFSVSLHLSFYVCPFSGCDRMLQVAHLGLFLVLRLIQSTRSSSSV